MGTSWRVDSDGRFGPAARAWLLQPRTAEQLEQSTHLAASLLGHIKQSQSSGQLGHRGPGPACRQWCNPFPCICQEGPAHLNLVFCIRPWLPGALCSSGRLKG